MATCCRICEMHQVETDELLFWATVLLPGQATSHSTLAADMSFLNGLAQATAFAVIQPRYIVARFLIFF